jgi:translation initiation factor 2B subunit (eIF-2B alpha/beta/delta family)
MMVNYGHYLSPTDLLESVSTLGTTLRSSDKMNFVVPNTIKRILHVIREAKTHYKFDNVTNDVQGMIDFGDVTNFSRQALDDSNLFESGMKHFE